MSYVNLKLDYENSTLSEEKMRVNGESDTVYTCVAGDTFHLPFLLSRLGLPVVGDVKLLATPLGPDGNASGPTVEWSQDWEHRDAAKGSGLIRREAGNGLFTGNYDVYISVVLDAAHQQGSDDCLIVGQFPLAVFPDPRV